MSPDSTRRAIAHVAQIDLTPESGMGRVAWHWRSALAARGFDFVHIGPQEVGSAIHPALFPYAAYRRYRRLRPEPALVLVHEPAGVPFVLAHPRTVAFSHGLERQAWRADLAQAAAENRTIRFRSRLLFPLWRLRQADFTLRRARAVLVLNRDDLAGVQQRYGRRPEEVFLFRNGVEEVPEPPETAPAAGPPALLCVGTWQARKGIRTLVEAASLLAERGIAPRWLLAGTGLSATAVLAEWPERLRPQVEVVPRFAAGEERQIFARAEIFLLPSFFEGQPLSLLQAMASGLCCIASDISGVRDLVVHRRTGLLHAAGDAGQLAAAIEESLRNIALRRELGLAARREVAGRTWEKSAGEVADFLVEIAARPSR